MNFLFDSNGSPDWILVTIILVIGLFLSAFFSGSETGFMSISRVRLRREETPDSSRERTLLEMLKQIEDPILTCLIGTNLCNVMISATLTVTLTALYPQYGQWLAVALGATLVITFGEILPKLLYREFPEPMVYSSLRGIKFSMLLFWPLRQVLLGYNKLLQSWLPEGGGASSDSLDRRSLAALLLTNTAPNQADRRFALLMDRYLKLEDITLGPVMRRLDDLVTVPSGATVRQCLETAAGHGFSRLPITDEDGRSMPGYVLVRDLLFLSREEHDQPVPRKLWRSFLLVDVRMSPYELFEELRSRNAQLAAVADPRGNLLGLITLEDLIETVIGSIHDEFDRDNLSGGNS